MHISSLAAAVHQSAKEHGWWEQERSFGDMMVLIHSEVSEAIEEYRKGYEPHEIYYVDGSSKPEGIPIELADVIIRVLDACAWYGIGIEAALAEKHSYNQKRPHRHGGKRL